MTYTKKLRRNIKLLYYSEFLSNLMFFIPIWVAFERQYLTFTQMSLIAALRFAITSFLELPTGALADLVGRKISVAIGFLSEALGLIIVGLSTNGTGILIGAIFRGSGDAFRSGSDTALLYDSLKELGEENVFSKIKSKFSLYNQFGIIISSILAGYLFDIWVGLPYLTYATFLIITAILYFLMQEPQIDSEKFTLKNYILQTRDGIRETLKTNYTKLVSIFYLTVGGITWAFNTYFNQIFASGIGYTEIGKSWLFAIIRLLNAIVLIRLLHIQRLVTKKRVYVLFPLVILVATLPAFSEQIIIGTSALFLLTLTSSMRFVVLDNFVNDEFTSKYRATAMSTLNLGVSVIYTVIVALGGKIIDNQGVGFLYSLLGMIAVIIIGPIGIILARHVNSR